VDDKSLIDLLLHWSVRPMLGVGIFLDSSIMLDRRLGLNKYDGCLANLCVSGGSVMFTDPHARLVVHLSTVIPCLHTDHCILLDCCVFVALLPTSSSG
jgi:hypothetical protein